MNKLRVKNLLGPTKNGCFCLQHRNLSALEVRSSFLDYFIQRDHTYVPSSSVIPEDDSSVAFVSAGMNQVDFFWNFLLKL